MNYAFFTLLATFIASFYCGNIEPKNIATLFFIKSFREHTCRSSENENKRKNTYQPRKH